MSYNCDSLPGKEVCYGYIGDPSTYWYCPKDDFPKYCKEVWHRDQA